MTNVHLIHQWMKEKEIKGIELAKMLGFKNETMSAKLRGYRGISPEEILMFEKLDPVALHRSKLRPDLWPPEHYSNEKSKNQGCGTAA